MRPDPLYKPLVEWFGNGFDHVCLERGRLARNQREARMFLNEAFGYGPCGRDARAPSPRGALALPGYRVFGSSLSSSRVVFSVTLGG